MNEAANNNETILVTGNDKLAFSITTCLLLAGCRVNLFTQEETKAMKIIRQHALDISCFTSDPINLNNLTILTKIKDGVDCDLTIAVTTENLGTKKGVIAQLEGSVPADTVIAINTESIFLSDIQKDAENPERIIGCNWVEPAHTTYFLEIIANKINHNGLINNFFSWAKEFLKKDPYVVKAGYSIRGRMMGALIREAFYLVENGYVSFEDVDRACRNDAGYYLPFTGNFRYMDLMGTYIYGLVMKDINPDLSKNRHIPQFFSDIISRGGQGMENKNGFYEYNNGEAEWWNEVSRHFNYQIQKIIEKYPFKYLEEKVQPEGKTLLNYE